MSDKLYDYREKQVMWALQAALYGPQDQRSPLLDGSPPFCRKCGCGGDWHYHGCIRGQQRGDTIWVKDGRLWDEAEATLVRIA